MNKELLVAIGYTIDGVRKEFKINNSGTIWCINSGLVSLEIPEGVRNVGCYINCLTELKLPNSVEQLSCRLNNIVELVIGENSMLYYLECDKHVKGLEHLIGHERKLIRLL